MIGRYWRAGAVACRVDTFLVIDADVKHHRRHAGAAEFGEILAGGGTACYLDCSGGATCPDGMDCIDNTLCMWPDLVCETPPPAGTYGDCLTGGNAICNNASAICLQDDTMNPMYAVCAPQDCVTDCDCPAGPGTGNATVSCGEIIADGGNACYLSCGAGETCPDGMTCFADFLCMWMP